MAHARQALLPEAGKVTVDVVSPEALLASRNVDQVVIPLIDGMAGILPGHAPVIASLKPGVVDMYDGPNIASRMFVSGGFAEVTPERCTVLADTAVYVDSLDRAAVDAELAELTAAFDRLPVGEDPGETGLQLAIARAKHDALEGAA